MTEELPVRYAFLAGFVVALILSVILITVSGYDKGMAVRLAVDYCMDRNGTVTLTSTLQENGYKCTLPNGSIVRLDDLPHSHNYYSFQSAGGAPS